MHKVYGDFVATFIDMENPKTRYDCITKNIITFTHNFDEFFCVSQPRSAQEMDIY